jgi:hypothetical protein
MTNERLAELRDHLLPGRNPDCISGAMLKECLDAIERQGAEIERFMIDRDQLKAEIERLSKAHEQWLPSGSDQARDSSD